MQKKTKKKKSAAKKKAQKKSTQKKSAAKKKAQKKSTAKKKAQKKSTQKKSAAKKKAQKKSTHKKSAAKKKTQKKSAAKKSAAKKSTQKKSAAKKKAPASKKAPQKSSAGSNKAASNKGSGASPAASDAGGGKAAKGGGKKGAQKGPVVRKPAHAEELKDKLGKLAQARTRIRSLKRSLDKSFFEIGTILAELEDASLHEVKGYGSFEAFLEREIDIGAQQAMRLVRIARSLQPQAASEAGLERSEAALAALAGEDDESSRFPFGSPIPPHKR